MSATRDLIELGDIDELVRYADRLCDGAEWDELVVLRDLSRAALERGKQLWPVATRVEYRLALDAPAAWAARVLVPGAGRFALGPLPEVAASTHSWEELAPHVPAGSPEVAVAAHERVVRGDDLTGDERVPPGIIELPLALAGWEPDYPLAIYKADEATFPLPRLTGFDDLTVPAARPDRVARDPEAERALLDLVTAWTSSSNGTAVASSVEGDGADALAAMGVTRARAVELTPATAVARMAWTAASGGAHGRRRGMAAGRFAAWWTIAALAGVLDGWPVPADDLGAEAAALRWYAWDRGHPDTGWVCRLAVEDPDAGLAWALDATDR